jgi:diadenosine tetraphosphate (Ap4A) HIT family hydrolase
MSDSFALHPQLAADTFPVRELALCQLVAMDCCAVPWLILVPQIAGAREIIDLTAADQHQLMSEIALVSRLLQTEFTPDKINVAALGNVVPQLHVHVIARFTTDAAWPKPVWGNVAIERYSHEDAKAFLNRLLNSKLLS